MVFWRKHPRYTLEQLIEDLNTEDQYDKAASYIYGRLQNQTGGKYAYLQKEDLEDIFQESLILVIENVRKGNLKDLKSLEGYFKTIFSRLCVNFIRLQKRLERDLGKVVTVAPPDAPPLSDDSYKGILDALDKGNGKEDILRQIEANFPQCYRLFFLRYFQKLSFEEIAKQMEYKSEGVVRARMSQCGKDIREKIEW